MAIAPMKPSAPFAGTAKVCVARRRPPGEKTETTSLDPLGFNTPRPTARALGLNLRSSASPEKLLYTPLAGLLNTPVATAPSSWPACEADEKIVRPGRMLPAEKTALFVALFSGLAKTAMPIAPIFAEANVWFDRAGAAAAKATSSV